MQGKGIERLNCRVCGKQSKEEVCLVCALEEEQYDQDQESFERFKKENKKEK